MTNYNRLAASVPGKDPFILPEGEWPQPLLFIEADILPGRAGIVDAHWADTRELVGRGAGRTARLRTSSGRIPYVNVVYEPAGYDKPDMDPEERPEAYACASFRLGQATINRLKNGGRLLSYNSENILDRGYVDFPLEASRQRDNLYLIDRVAGSKQEASLVIQGVAAAFGLQGKDVSAFSHAVLRAFPGLT